MDKSGRWGLVVVADVGNEQNVTRSFARRRRGYRRSSNYLRIRRSVVVAAHCTHTLHTRLRFIRTKYQEHNCRQWQDRQQKYIVSDTGVIWRDNSWMRPILTGTVTSHSSLRG